MKALRRTTAPGGPWYEFTHQTCPICGSTGWCMIHEDQNRVVCQRIESKKTWGKDMKGYLHFLKEPAKFDFENDADAEAVNTKEKNPDGHLHRVFKSMIACSELTDDHYNHLTGEKRQMKEEQIEMRGYVSFPDKPWQLLDSMIDFLGLSNPKLLLGTPGIYLHENARQSYLSLNGSDSILIPFRNEKQQIVGMQHRVDKVLYSLKQDKMNTHFTARIIQQPNTVEMAYKDKVFWTGEMPIGEWKQIKIKGKELGHLKIAKGQRYLWLSSAKKNEGTGAGPLPVHVSIPTERLAQHEPGTVVKTDTVWITEGPLKGDICADLIKDNYSQEEIKEIGDTFICIPGVQSWRLALPILEKMEVKTVNVALDADATSNLNVREVLKELGKELAVRGLNVNVVMWNEEFGKGLDDLFLAKQYLPQIRPLTKRNKVRA